MKQILSILVAVPILALFFGVGVLSYNIAGTWDQRNTDGLVSGVTTACLAFAIVISLSLSCFLGAMVFTRWQKDRHWEALPRGSPWAQDPPQQQITTTKPDTGTGSWESTGSYDIIPEDFNGMKGLRRDDNDF